MNEHLPEPRISRWMTGERAPEDERHVRECAQCAAELARFEAALSQFRESVRQWSGGQGGSPPGAVLEIRPARRRFAPWAAAAAAVLLAVAVPVYRSSRRPQPGPDIAQADALLLEQVDAHVSQAVPRPMEPLLELVSGDLGGSPGHAKEKEKQ